MTNGVKVHGNLCTGCAHCIQSCPTEAMRVIDGCLRIIQDICIECGECIRQCPTKAITIG